MVKKLISYVIEFECVTYGGEIEVEESNQIWNWNEVSDNG